MPNRPVHLAAAVSLGTLVSIHKARGLNGLQYVAEIAGGALGGAVGGLGPDWVDPPTSPFHRGVGHSAAISCVMTGLASRRIDAWQAWLREEAARFRCLQNVVVDPLLRAFHGICYVLICLVSGALVGFLAGWGSHLALDFGSVRSLPLI